MVNFPSKFVAMAFFLYDQDWSGPNEVPIRASELRKLVASSPRAIFAARFSSAR